MSETPEAPAAGVFVQYSCFKVAPEWRRLSASARADGRAQFERVVAEYDHTIKTAAYSTIGLKLDTDLLLWRKGGDPIVAQEMTSRLLNAGIGTFAEITYQLYGFTRPSNYTKRQTMQEQAIDVEDRLTYLTVYPFSKTTEWYLMSRDARQGMMNEHMRIGHDYEDVRQVLLYSTGIDDQEFVVAYEMEQLPRFIELVTALRNTEARRYTLKDQPIITGVHRPLSEALALI